MNDHQLPPHDGESNHYQRPNQQWNCGWLSQGKPCPRGPEGDGKCGAVPDCTPALAASRQGDKPIPTCTRAKALGGPCEEGPRSDGSCSHPPISCHPKPTLRAKRGLVTRSVMALTVGTLLFLLFGPWRWSFLSPGKLSMQHDSEVFHQRAKQLSGGQQCSACHSAAKGGPASWVQAAFAASPSPLQLGVLTKNFKPSQTRIDVNCQQCHQQNHFHEPTVLKDYSCSACHQEHQGSKRLNQVDANHCLVCHGDQQLMTASAKKGEAMEADMFSFQQDKTRISFKTTRPREGYSQAIHEFSKDHPEFQIHRGGYRDPNTLRFSHATHSGQNPAMTAPGGRPLLCSACHKTGPDGLYFTPPTFEQNCRSCHQLPLDPEHPQLTLPHGNPAAVRAFLRSLPQQYADYAFKTKITRSPEQTEAFVQERIGAMRSLYGSGEQLERKLFFSNERTGPNNKVGDLPATGRSLFAGCAYCHQVKESGDLPVVTPPVIPERWLSQGKFNHGKHSTTSCVTCHSQALSSPQAADIMLPGQKSCATCHNPRGAARNECTECHNFHHTPPAPSSAGVPSLTEAIQKSDSRSAPGYSSHPGGEASD